MLKAFAILVLYAVLVVALGILAYSDAPEGANAATALIVPIAVAVVSLGCAAMALMIHKNRTVGMIGIHLGIVIPLLVAIAVGHRAYVAHQASESYKEGQSLWEQRVQGGGINTPSAREKFFEENKYPDHDKGYLRGALVAISAVSLQTFVTMIVARPKPPARKPKPQADADAS
ncbi:hypothetical protein AY599_18415 [Leptolyngbya valderiana BDU 20041]|nr:hypothetical protein AY599_18415 [Leptolyngbya valderiana BDU 20041]